ncbi:MAG: hypothetical protein OXI13_06620 [Gammaproteobacteria bacterium]|nr:hypothetical protein [Gammaproteobacteria bacterium]
MTDPTKDGLLRFTKESYDGCFNEDLLDQYKLYVQSAENVSARRIASSRYLLTFNTALVALYGFQSQIPSWGWLMVLVPILGVLASALWCQIIKSHKDLNAVKFEIIHELEQHFPARLYAYEWQRANEGRGKRYRAVTDTEGWIPWVFLVLHPVLSIFLFIDSTSVH